ncbi:MAG: allantoinase AllB [Acidobacteriota bacterium]
MSLPQLLLRGRRVVTPDGLGPASVRVRGGRVAAVGPLDAPADGASVLDFGDAVVMPGLVDTHVHVNEPGRTDWEGFAAATRAAAAGGITTLFDMPLNSVPPTTTVKGFKAKLEAAAGRCFVDVGFWGGLVPRNRGQLMPLFRRGVPGFKCFLSPSGVEEFPPVAEADLARALPALAAAGALVLVHAETPDRIGTVAGDPRRYASYLASRPPAAEAEAARLLLRLCRESGVPIHIVHLSSAEALPALWEAKREGLPLSAETCPHYLTFSAEEIPEGATEFKCAPPIRGRENRERLWQALEEGLVGMIVSDHSPAPPEAKRREAGDFAAAWGGISSLQLGLPAVWTAARERGAPIERLAEWMCRGPARLAGLASRKGALAPGYDADFVVWRPEASFEVRPEAIHHRHKLTPYSGRTLKGVVEATYLRGEKIYEAGSFAEPPRGEILLSP